MGILLLDKPLCLYTFPRVPPSLGICVPHNTLGDCSLSHSSFYTERVVHRTFDNWQTRFDNYPPHYHVLVWPWIVVHLYSCGRWSEVNNVLVVGSVSKRLQMAARGDWIMAEPSKRDSSKAFGFWFSTWCNQRGGDSLIFTSRLETTYIRVCRVWLIDRFVVAVVIGLEKSEWRVPATFISIATTSRMMHDACWMFWVSHVAKDQSANKNASTLAYKIFLIWKWQKTGPS